MSGAPGNTYDNVLKSMAVANAITDQREKNAKGKKQGGRRSRKQRKSRKPSRKGRKSSKRRR